MAEKFEIWHNDHNFVNREDDIVYIVRLEAGEKVRVRDMKGRPYDYGDYVAQMDGDEVEVPPHHQMEILENP